MFIAERFIIINDFIVLLLIKVKLIKHVRIVFMKKMLV